MNYIEFENLLKKLNLTKKEFSKLSELSYQTVMSWAKTNNVPNWVKSWRQNYIDKKKFERIKAMIRDEINRYIYGVCLVVSSIPIFNFNVSVN